MSSLNRKKKQTFHPRDASQLPEGLLAPVTTTNAQIAARMPTKVILKAQTPTQKIYIRKLKRDEHDILFATGPAGTGKTYIATIHAIQEYQAGNCTKIVITRPTVASGDEDYGYLPGTIIEKLAPWMMPIIEVFEEFYPVAVVERMIKDKTIEIAPLGFMRGRTIKNAIVIADEMQNASPDQMKMLLTRIGEGTHMIITGDVEQHDRGHAMSGLADITGKLARRDAERAAEAVDPLDGDLFGMPVNIRRDRLGVVRFDKSDVVRHPVIEEVLELYA